MPGTDLNDKWAERLNGSKQCLHSTLYSLQWAMLKCSLGALLLAQHWCCVQIFKFAVCETMRCTLDVQCAGTASCAASVHCFFCAVASAHPMCSVWCCTMAQMYTVHCTGLHCFLRHISAPQCKVQCAEVQHSLLKCTTLSSVLCNEMQWSASVQVH